MILFALMELDADDAHDEFADAMLMSPASEDLIASECHEAPTSKRHGHVRYRSPLLRMFPTSLASDGQTGSRLSKQIILTLQACRP
jgi:hypothetical protein